MIDYEYLATLPQDQALAYLQRELGAQSAGPITNQGGGSAEAWGSGGMDAAGNRYDAPLTGMAGYSEDPEGAWMQTPDGGMVRADPSLYGRYLGGEMNVGGQAGQYIGAYDQSGNLQSTYFDPKEKYGFMDQWGGPLAIAGAALGGGLLAGSDWGAAAIAEGAGEGITAGTSAPFTASASAEMVSPLATGGAGTAAEAAGPGLSWDAASAGLSAEASHAAALAGVPYAAPAAGAGAGAGLFGGAGAALAPYAPLIGAVGGALASGQTQGGTTSQTREPWAPAQDWLKQQIATGQQLQQHYQQNPFNAQQRTAYQNQAGDLDAFRGQMAPGLMSFANGLMTPYQRQARRGETLPDRATSPAPFSAPAGGQYGLLDWDAMNPFRTGLMG